MITTRACDLSTA